MNWIHKNFLAKELVKWRESGIVDTPTAENIAKHYGIDLQNLGDGNSFVLKLVAYLFFALSLLTLIGSNWEELPRILRLFIVLSITCLVNLGGYFALKNGKESQSTALFFLGNFCYGGAIALIAQIYHLGEHMPNGILLWAVGAFALAFACQKSILTAQALIIALIWFVMELEFQTISHGIVLFFILSIISLLKDESKLLTLVLFVGIFLYLTAEFNSYLIFVRTSNVVIFLALSYSLLCVSISLVLAEFGRLSLSEFLKKIAILAGLITLVLAMSIPDYGFYESEFEAKDIFAFYKSFYGIIYLAFVCICLAVFVKFRQFYGVVICGLMFILPILTELLLGYVNVLYSFVAVIVGVILIKQGYMKLGLFAIFAVAVVRYIDLVGDYIGASLLFLAFAVTTLIISKKRGL